MAFGAPGVESFRRVITRSRNHHFVPLIASLLVFRQELVSNDDFTDRGGMDDVTRDHLMKHLVNADRIRRRLTYNPDGLPLGDLITKAIDTKEQIETAVNPLGGDEVQGQSGADFDLPFDFDGTNPDFPPQSALNMTAPVGVMLLNALDQAIVTITRLESRHRTRFYTQMDSMRIYQQFQQLHEALTALAGDLNRVDIVNPLPSDEPLGPTASANRTA